MTRRSHDRVSVKIYREPDGSRMLVETRTTAIGNYKTLASAIAAKDAYETKARRARASNLRVQTSTAAVLPNPWLDHDHD